MKQNQRSTKRQWEQESRPVCVIGTHCPAGWGWQASCMGLRRGRGLVFGRTAAGTAIPSPQDCSHSRWYEWQPTLCSSYRPCKDTEPLRTTWNSHTQQSTSCQWELVSHSIILRDRYGFDMSSFIYTCVSGRLHKKATAHTVEAVLDRMNNLITILLLVKFY